MAIKVTMLDGETDKRVSGLYQWDYGQTLEIEAPYLPTIVEVHFACRDMTEAIVYVCSTNLNVASVAIPDTCLEHTGEITAWVYGIEGTSGRTLYRVVIPIIARARPSRTEFIPPEVDDNYTQLISEVNEAVENITGGSVIAAQAIHATSADRATQADNASSAAYATQAENATRATSASTAIHADRAMLAEKAVEATTATNATNATNDGDGNKFSVTYVKKIRDDFQKVTSSKIWSDKLVYLAKVVWLGRNYYGVFCYEANTVCSCALGYVWMDSSEVGSFCLTLQINADGEIAVYRETSGNDELRLTDAVIYIRVL